MRLRRCAGADSDQLTCTVRCLDLQNAMRPAIPLSANVDPPVGVRRLSTLSHLMGHQQRQTHAVKQVASNAAQQLLPKFRVPEGACDEQVCAERARLVL